MKSLFFVLLNCQLPFAIGLTANRTYAACRPPGEWAFRFGCSEDAVTWIVDAFFGETVYPPSVENFCDLPLPNRTDECIPQRSSNTRDIRLACNGVRGPCWPTGSAEIMNSFTFENCSSLRPFTYAYASYDCLPAFRTTVDRSPIDYVYVNQTALPKSSVEKIYLMSANYDTHGYTTSPVNRCSVRVSSSRGGLYAVRFTVLDLLGQTTGSPAVSCPYTLSIGAAGYSKVWCAQPTWDNFGIYTLDVPAISGAQQIDVNFDADTDAASIQGRFWVLLEGLTNDGTVAAMEISSGGMITASTVRPTPVRATTSTTTTTTTTPTATSSTATARTTPSASVAATTVLSSVASSSATTATTQSRSTIGQPTTTTTTTTTTTKATPVIVADTTTTTATTAASVAMSVPSIPPTASDSRVTQQTQSMNWSDNNSSPIISTTVSPIKEIGSAESNFDPRTSSLVVAVAAGVSALGVILLCVSIPVIVCLCMYCSEKKHRSKNRRTEPIFDNTLTRKDAMLVHSADPSSAVAERAQTAVEIRREGVYSPIDDDSMTGVTIEHSGTIDSNDPSTVEHHIKVRYTVRGVKGKQKRLKGRPPELDGEQWDSPPSYSDRNKAHDPSGDHSAPKVQRNPIFGKESEDYNY